MGYTLIAPGTIRWGDDKAPGPVRVVIPARGWSETDGEGAPLYEPETNQVFVEERRRLLRSKTSIVEIDAYINEPGYAKAAVLALDELMHTHRFHEKDKHSQGTRKESLDR